MPFNCRSCGAPLKGDEEHCPYCGNRIECEGKQQIEKKTQSQKLEIEQRERLKELPRITYASGGFIITVSILTCGFYGIYWYLTRRESFNNLVEGMKFPEISLIIYIIGWVILFCSPENADDLNSIAYLVTLCTAFYMAYSVKKILREYASHHFDVITSLKIVAPSNIALFFFGYIYLQFQINKMINLEIIAPKL